MKNGVSFDDCFLGLDIDTKHIGWSVIRGSFHNTGHAVFDRLHFGKFLMMYRAWLRDLITEQQPAVICIELPFIGQPTAVGPLYKIHGVTEMTLAGFVGAVDHVHSATWKKQVCGRGNITTAEKRAGMIINIVNKMGFDDVDQIDEADALCIALHERNKLTGRMV